MIIMLCDLAAISSRQVRTDGTRHPAPHLSERLFARASPFRSWEGAKGKGITSCRKRVVKGVLQTPPSNGTPTEISPFHSPIITNVMPR